MTTKTRLNAIRLMEKLEKDKEMALLIEIKLVENEKLKKLKKEEKSSWNGN